MVCVVLEPDRPAVVGATQGAACFGAAYEFVFNLTYHLKKQGLKYR
jgi:sulfide:quinone oxidoreductase